MQTGKGVSYVFLAKDWMQGIGCPDTFFWRWELVVFGRRPTNIYSMPSPLLSPLRAVNNGNWMWLSASAFFSQYFRVYSPATFGKQYDPQGAYIRRFVPALKNMPAKYIYEPWLAPLDVQRAAGCVVGKDYPAPIVDHAVASKENMAKMKVAYAAARGELNEEDGKEKEKGEAPVKKKQKKI
jgi:cryptochrome